MFGLQLWKLQWIRKRRIPSALPEGIERSYVRGDYGNLELLYAPPSSSRQHKIPLLFVHGAFGCAEVYADYLLYFSRKGFHCYAVSVRGHGNSFYPSFIWMTFFTSFHTFALDVCAAIECINYVHGTAPIYFGHSAGGGLGQYIVSKNLAPVSALALLSCVPGFGAFQVYKNWNIMDPWYLVRAYMRGLGHPRSPLSSTQLVRHAFFSSALSEESVRAFESKMPPWESFRWPFSMVFKFVDLEKVVANLSASFAGGSRMLVLTASRDILIGTRLMGQLTDVYRAGRRALQLGKKVEPIKDMVIEESEKKVADESGPLTGVTKRGTVDGITFDIIEEAGHQFMNDVHWEHSADIIYGWLQHMV